MNDPLLTFSVFMIALYYWTYFLIWEYRKCRTSPPIKENGQEMVIQLKRQNDLYQSTQDLEIQNSIQLKRQNDLREKRMEFEMQQKA